MKILHIDASARKNDSLSRLVAAKVVDALTRAHPQASVTHLDLADERPAFLDELTLTAMELPEDQLTAESREATRQSRRYVELMQDADIYVLGVPIYNFGVPAALKAFIDQSLVAGKLFRFRNGKFEGLLQGKKLFAAIASGSQYNGSKGSPNSLVDEFIKAVFEFVGVKNITILHASGHNAQQVQAALQENSEQIDQLLANDVISGGSYENRLVGDYVNAC